MKNIIIIPFLFLVIGFSACSDAEIQPREYAIVFTGNATEIDQSGVTLHAEMISPGQDKIIEYGFIVTNNVYYGFNTYNTYNNFRKIYSTKAELKTSTYEKRITSDLKSGYAYFCRAFVIINQDSILGNKILFTSKGPNQ